MASSWICQRVQLGPAQYASVAMEPQYSKTGRREFPDIGELSWKPFDPYVHQPAIQCSSFSGTGALHSLWSAILHVFDNYKSGGAPAPHVGEPKGWPILWVDVEFRYRRH